MCVLTRGLRLIDGEKNDIWFPYTCNRCQKMKSYDCRIGFLWKLIQLGLTIYKILKTDLQYFGRGTKEET